MKNQTTQFSTISSPHLTNWGSSNCLETQYHFFFHDSHNWCSLSLSAFILVSPHGFGSGEAQCTKVWRLQFYPHQDFYFYNPLLIARFFLHFYHLYTLNISQPHLLQLHTFCGITALCQSVPRLWQHLFKWLHCDSLQSPTMTFCPLPWSSYM